MKDRERQELAAQPTPLSEAFGPDPDFFASKYNSQILGEETFEQSLQAALGIVLAHLPFEAAALVFLDEQTDTLQVYAGRGIYEQSKILAQFTFKLNTGVEITNDSHFLIPLAFQALHSTTSRTLRSLRKEWSLAFDPIIESSGSSIFCITDVQSIAPTTFVHVLDVYQPGHELRDFVAAPIYDPSKTSIFPVGLLVLNNISIASNPAPGQATFRSTGPTLRSYSSIQSDLAPRILRMAEAVALPLQHVSLRYEFTRSTKVFSSLRSVFATYTQRHFIGPTEAIRQAASLLAVNLTALFSADLAALYQCVDEAQPRVVWESRTDAAARLEGEVTSNRLHEFLFSRKPVLLNTTANGAFLKSSCLSIQLWFDAARTESFSLLLLRFPINDFSVARFSSAFLPEDRDVAEYSRGEIRRWLDLLYLSYSTVERQAKSWRDLASRNVHKLKSPLAAISFDLQEIFERVPRRLRSQVNALQGKVDRLYDRLNEFIRFGKTVKSELLPTDLNKLISDAAQKVFSRSDALPGYELVIDNSLPTISLDSQQILDAFEELLYNAKKNACDKTVTVTLTHSKVPAQKSDTAKVTIHNWSCIEPDLIKESRLFEPFVSGSEGSTGLGLAFVKEVIDAHGGALEVQSTPAEGTEFSVTLPVSSHDSEDRESYACSEKKG